MGADAELSELIRQAAAGDAAAWRGVVSRYGPRVYGLIYRQCRDGDLAEELTQATFVTVVEKIGKYQERGRFEPWLVRIAMNRLRDHMRRVGRQARPVEMSSLGDLRSAAEAPLDRLTRVEQVQQLRAWVAELPEADQQVLYLRHTAGLSFAQIAETLGQPLGTVLARGHRALKKLRERFSALEGRESGEDRREP